MKRLLFIFTAIVFLAGCRKGEVVTPKFEVATSSTVVRAGVPVVFDFTAMPILFRFIQGRWVTHMPIMIRIVLPRPIWLLRSQQ